MRGLKRIPLKLKGKYSEHNILKVGGIPSSICTAKKEEYLRKEKRKKLARAAGTLHFLLSQEAIRVTVVAVA